MLPLPAGAQASSSVGVPVHTRYRPERTLLHQRVQESYPAPKAHLAGQGTDLPGNIEQEFEAYLKCGRGVYVERPYGSVRIRWDEGPKG